jgi:hypothetical protein
MSVTWESEDGEEAGQAEEATGSEAKNVSSSVV